MFNVCRDTVHVVLSSMCAEVVCISDVVPMCAEVLCISDVVLHCTVFALQFYLAPPRSQQSQLISNGVLCCTALELHTQQLLI